MSAENNWTWPPSMDAVVAAPESHRVLFENDDVRALEVTIAAGIANLSTLTGTPAS